MKNNFRPTVKLTPKDWRDEFAAASKRYRSEWANIFGDEPPVFRKNLLGMIRRASKNFMRIPSDIVRIKRNRHQEKQQDGDVKIVIEDRELVLRDAKRGKINERSRHVYQALALNELATEVNCRNVMRITGLGLGCFYNILTSFDCNIRPFFSEHKGENGGRWVRDNWNLSEIVGAGILDEEADHYYLDKMFPRVPMWLPWGRWTNSRTHGVIYEIKNADGSTELIVPAHIDAENALVAIQEMITGKKRREIAAIEYHRMPEEQGEAYVGSGLGELGCVVLAGIMKRAAEKGKIRSLEISGMEKLSTSGSIARDNEFMWDLHRLVRKGRVIPNLL